MVGFAAKLRSTLFKHIQSLSYSKLDTQGTGTLIARITGDINQVQSGMNLALRLLLRSPFVVFGAMIMAFTIDVKAALVFVVTIPLLSIVVFGIMLWSIPMYKKVQQKLDRVAETEFSVDGAELDMEEAVTLMERLRLAAVGEFIAQNTGDDAGALTAQTQQWLLDAQSVIPQPIRPYIDLSGEVFAESGWILDTASGTVFSAIRASLHHTPFIDTIILLDAQTGRLLHLEMLFYQESDYLIQLQDLPDCLEDAGGWRQQAADYYGLTANAFRPEDSLVKQWYSTAEPSELGFVLGDADGNAVTYGFRHGAAPGMAIALGSFGS